jgi:seryl-tRNA synthetase
MLDPQYLKNNLNDVATKLLKKGFILDKETFSELETRRKDLQADTQSLQQLRNEKSKQVGILKSKGEDANDLMQELNSIRDKLKDHENELNLLQNKISHFCLSIPNIPHETVPSGKSEDDNVEVSKFGEPKAFDFKVKDHSDLGEALNMIDFSRAAKLSGSRFVILQSQLAKLNRALIQFMLETHVNNNGYTELYVPYMVNETCLYGTGALPKMAEDLYKVEGDNDLYLIPTAEVPVTNIYQNEIIDEDKLPLKYVAHTPCFRSEAGSYGKDTKGMMRQHQFEKVELVQFVRATESFNALEELRSAAENILQQLELPYRVVNLCGGDLSFSSTKTYDIEVWLPSQECYREISSCSNFIDFQARRAKIRTKSSTTKKTEFVHTINGSGLAIGRTLVAILENYQNEDGSVTVPKVLRPYMGIDKITAIM